MVRAGCIAARTPPGFCHRLLTACGETHVSAEVGQFSRWGRGARPTRRVREEYLVYFDRNATKNGAKRSGSGGMHRRPNAAWVLPPAVKPAPRPRRVPEPSPHGRGAARGSDRLPAVDACERVGVSSRPRASAQSAAPGFAAGPRCPSGMSFWDVLWPLIPKPDFRNLPDLRTDHRRGPRSPAGSPCTGGVWCTAIPARWWIRES